MQRNVLGVLLVLGAAAGTSFGGVVRLDNTQSGWGGGGFLLSQSSGNNGQMGGTGGSTNGGAYSLGSIMTFCLEANEYFHPGQDYTTVMNNGAVNGGQSGGNP